MNNEEKKQGGSRGFAGLSSIVSDVDDVISRKPKPSDDSPIEPSPVLSSGGNPRPKPSAQPSDGNQRPKPSVPSQSSGSFSTVLWMVAALIVGLVGIANQSDKNGPSKSAYSSEKPSASIAPVSKSTIGQPQTSSRPSESKPSFGRNQVLSTEELRYCLAEKIRLDSGESILNNYSDSDVNSFNNHVDDYNRRCGEFRYRQGTLESARRDVEPYRDQLQIEGRNRFVSSSVSAVSKPLSKAVSSPGSKSVSKPSTPDVTVLAIQRHLNELGYNAGKPDGFFGSKTRSAIEAYQRDKGLAVDGIANSILLQTIQMNTGSLVDENLATETKSSQTQTKNGLPKNSSLASWGSDWVCNTGYYKSGNQCLAVKIPKNGSLASWGSDWVCNAGYYKSGIQCLAVQIPKNGSLASWGSDWVCNEGYYKSGNRCLAVKIPKNGSLASWGSDWVCNKGYYKSGNQCLAVKIPKNGSLASWGSDWVCNPGYRRVGDRCD